MTVREDMVNGHELCHGGLIFTLADSAFAFACNTYDAVTVASAASVEFLLPARLGDELTAIAEERSRSKRTGVYDVAVRNQQGDCVALFRGRSHELGGSVIEGSMKLEPIETASLDELRALQLQRLQWSLLHAYENVAHYRESFRAAGVHPA